MFNADGIQGRMIKAITSFFIKTVQIEFTSPEAGQVLKFTSATKVENVADPALDPYTIFTFNEEGLTPAGAIRTYKGSTLIETLNLDAYYVNATELTTILASYQTLAAAKNVWRLHLNSGGSTGDVATRITGLTEGTDYPTGWTLAVGGTATSLTVTHGLGRELSTIFVWSKDPSTSKRQEMKGDLGYVALYSASDLNSFEIDTLAQIARELYVYIVFY